MNRPARVRTPEGMAGYRAVPPFAWSGWRLRIPGGPEGGQYHGFIGPDSKGWPSGHDEIATDDFAALGDITTEPWRTLWGGTVLREGQSQSDHVYRSSAEMRPRSNANGGANVVSGFQRRRTAGFAEAPGNYRGVGLMVPSFPVVRIPSPVRFSFPAQSGATSVVAQPAPPTGTSNPYTVPWSVPPVSPAPSPTVAAGPSNFIPSQGQPLPPISGSPWAPGVAYPLGSLITDSNGNLQQSTAVGTSGATQPMWSTTVGNTTSDGSVVWTLVQLGGGASSLTSWFSQSTVIPGVENLWIAAGGVLALVLMMRGGKK